MRSKAEIALPSGHREFQRDWKSHFCLLTQPLVPRRFSCEIPPSCLGQMPTPASTSLLTATPRKLCAFHPVSLREAHTEHFQVEQASACLFLNFANAAKVKCKQAEACSTWNDTQLGSTTRRAEIVHQCASSPGIAIIRAARRIAALAAESTRRAQRTRRTGTSDSQPELILNSLGFLRVPLHY